MRTHLKLYERPDNYAGETFYGTYPVYGKHRDSDLLTESNFMVIAAGLGNLSDKLGCPDETVRIARASHWAVGWVETIYLDANAPEELLDLAESYLESIEQYPILDEMDYSNRQGKAVYDYWYHANEDERERLMENAGDTSGLSDRVYDYLLEMFP